MRSGGILLRDILLWLYKTKPWHRQLALGFSALLIGLGAPSRSNAAPAPASPAQEIKASTDSSFVLPQSVRLANRPLRWVRSSAPVGHLYHIQWGDSLWSIAAKFNISVGALEQANNLDSSTIYAGQNLVIPQTYTVQAGDTLATIANKYGVPLLLLWHENRLVSDKLSPGQSLIIPYQGPFTNAAYSPAPQPLAAAALSNRSLPQVTQFSPDDILLLAHLVQAEAGNQPFVGQVAVAAVVINRLNAPGFPKTLSGVIEDPGQFESVSNGSIWQSPGALAFMAAKAAMKGWDPTHGALFYYNPNLPHADWMNSLPMTAAIGAQVFCR